VGILAVCRGICAGVCLLALAVDQSAVVLFLLGLESVHRIRGLLGESKIDILDKISDEFKPKTLFFSAKTTTETVADQLTERGLVFPVIAKSNAGERGWRVEKLEQWDELVTYIADSPVDFLV
jgi:hypothetical protein